MSDLGTADRLLRVAIIGAGPSGFYAAEHLLEQKALSVEVDIFDRLPTPYGLVRGGVAPDHQKIKSVTQLYDRIASQPGFCFYGNVEFGTDLRRGDMVNYYHALIYAVGAQTDRKLGIPGEDLPGSHPATEFVAWYNAHPDYRELEFDLSQENVAVVGVGNVAMDVARILARSWDELYATDIADYALDALSGSQVKNIYILGRRGPAQAAFTTPELKELGELAIADVVVSPREVILDPLSQAFLDGGEDKVAVKNVKLLKHYAESPAAGKARKVIFRFLVSPVEIIGTDRVEAIKIVKNELYWSEGGELRPRPTEEYETIPVGLVFRSVGYRGVPLPDVPFYDPWGIIPNDKGRVTTQLQDGKQVIGDYVVGWIKRGPYGVIGTNKPDAVETVETLLEDARAGKVLSPSKPDHSALESLLHKRGVRYITYEDWQILDRLEMERGRSVGRPRIKFSRVEEMLAALEEDRKKSQ